MREIGSVCVHVYARGVSALVVCASIQLVAVTCVSEHTVQGERGLVAVMRVRKHTIGGSYVCEQAFGRGGEGIGGG